LLTGGGEDAYAQIIKEQRAASEERYPEFDVVGIFREIITGTQQTSRHCLPPEKLDQLPFSLPRRTAPRRAFAAAL